MCRWRIFIWTCWTINVFTRGPYRPRPSAPSLVRVDVLRRNWHSATSLRRKNKRVARNLLRRVMGTISEAFCNTNSDLWAPCVVTLQEVVLLLWEIEQADDPELLYEISSRIAMYIHWPAVHTPVSAFSIYFSLLRACVIKRASPLTPEPSQPQPFVWMVLIFRARSCASGGVGNRDFICIRQ
jgi:hypothetical protein